MQNHRFLRVQLIVLQEDKVTRLWGVWKCRKKKLPVKTRYFLEQECQISQSLEFDKGGLELRSGECHDVVSLNEFFEVSISCSF